MTDIEVAGSQNFMCNDSLTELLKIQHPGLSLQAERESCGAGGCYDIHICITYSVLCLHDSMRTEIALEVQR